MLCCAVPGRALQRFYPKLFIYDLEEMGTSTNLDELTNREKMGRKRVISLHSNHFKSILCRKEQEKNFHWTWHDMAQTHTQTVSSHI